MTQYQYKRLELKVSEQLLEDIYNQKIQKIEQNQQFELKLWESGLLVIKDKTFLVTHETESNHHYFKIKLKNLYKT